MDYKNRSYYLVKISYEARQFRDKILKNIETVEFHPPYGHFEIGKYDGLFKKITGILSPSYMLSCDVRYSDIVEFELGKAKRNDIASNFFKLSKEICKQ